MTQIWDLDENVISILPNDDFFNDLLEGEWREDLPTVDPTHGRLVVFPPALITEFYSTLKKHS